MLDGGFLFLIHEGVVVHVRSQILKIVEQLVGLDHVLVRIVKITDEQFSPEIEIIQSFVALGFLAEYFIQFANQFYGIGYLVMGEFAEQFADADIGGRPDRGVRLLCQVFVEEQTGAFVGKYDCCFCQISSLAAI